MKIYTRIISDWDGNEILNDWFSYAGSVTEAKGGSTTVQQTSTAPWTVQQPYLTKGFQEAQSLYNSDKPQYFPDSTVAPQSGDTQSAIRQMGQGSSLPGTAASQASDTLNGGYLKSPQAWASQTYNPNANAMNPFVQGANDYIGNVTNSIARSVIPQVQQGFAAAGRTGESPLAQTAMAKGIADALAPYQFNSAEAQQGRNFQAGSQLAGQQFQAGESAVSRGMSAYDAERQRQLAATGMAPELTSAQYIPAQEQLASGQLQDQQSQKQLQDLVDRFNFGQNVQGQKLNDYMARIQGNYGTAGTNVSQTKVQSDPLMTALGLGGMAAGLGTTGGGTLGASALGK